MLDLSRAELSAVIRAVEERCTKLALLANMVRWQPFQFGDNPSSANALKENEVLKSALNKLEKHKINARRTRQDAPGGAQSEINE